MNDLHSIIQASASLEGSTLNATECALLLSKGISSAGKTIKEQLLCLDLQEAYKLCWDSAKSREYWSVFRLKNIAALALRSSSISATASSAEWVLQKVCDIANSHRLHIVESRTDEMYRGSFEIHYLVSLYRPWGNGSDFIGRLLMNYLQFECQLEPTIIRPSQQNEYKRILRAATYQEICEIFVSYMSEHRADLPEKENAEASVTTGTLAMASGGPTTEKRVAASASSPSSKRSKVTDAERSASSGKSLSRDTSSRANAVDNAKPSSRDQILSLLRSHPYMSTRDLAEQIGISAKGVEKNLGILKANGNLRRIGPDKGGHWEVV